MKKKIGFAASVAVAASLLFAPAAQAAPGWHGPYRNVVTCNASWMTIKFKPTSVPLEQTRPCAKHADGKWWYRW